MNGKRRLIGSFWHGSMANAMAQGVGAQAAFPGRQVVSLSGDGGFTMLMGDLLTLSQHRLPVKVVVFNNGALGFIELEQKIEAGFSISARSSRTRTLPRWPTPSRHTPPGEVDDGFAAAFAHDGPVLVDAEVDASSAFSTMLMPAWTSGFSLLSALAAALARSSATPPPGTIPSSTAARVE